MKYQYHEGDKAKTSFENAMKAIFKAPKTVSVRAKVKRPMKAAISRKTDVSDKN